MLRRFDIDGRRAPAADELHHRDPADGRDRAGACRSRPSSSSWTSRRPRSTSTRWQVLFGVIRQLRATASRSSSSATGSTSSTRSATGSRSCATGAPSTSARCRTSAKLRAGLDDARPRAGRAAARAGPARGRRAPRHAADARRGRPAPWSRRWTVSRCRSAPGEIVGLAGLLGSGRTESGARRLRRRRAGRRRRSRSTAAGLNLRRPADAIRNRHRLLLRGPQDRGHHRPTCRCARTSRWRCCRT